MLTPGLMLFATPSGNYGVLRVAWVEPKDWRHG